MGRHHMAFVATGCFTRRASAMVAFLVTKIGHARWPTDGWMLDSQRRRDERRPTSR